MNDHTQEFKCITTWINIQRKDHHIDNEKECFWAVFSKTPETWVMGVLKAQRPACSARGS
jgi:hypothetical protein